MEIKNPSNFLHYGYDLVTAREQLEFVKGSKFGENVEGAFSRLGETFCEKKTGNEILTRDLTSLINLGRYYWDKSISECLARSCSPVVVPISGGLDSRLILASLLEHLPAKKIATYTFGSKGTFDFEIGNKVAEIAGTNHVSYNLEEFNPDLPSLEENSLYSLSASDLFTAPPLSRIKSDFSPRSTLWVGYMGDPSVGSHSHQILGNDKSWAEYIFRKECYTGDISFAKFITGKVADQPDLPGGLKLTAGEKAELWDLENRQKNYVLSQVCRGPFNFEVPFLNQSWLDFAFALPQVYRFNTKFYKEFLCARHPKFFQIPVKQNLGLPLKMSLVDKCQFIIRKLLIRYRSKKWRSKCLNYQNYEILLRKDFQTHGSMWELLIQLSKRTGINEGAVIQTLNDFMFEKISASRLTLLISLEIGLQEG